MSKIRVILVDDHQIVRDGIKSLIANEPDIEVIGEASNHTEFFELLGSKSPDIVMLDISMPEVSGIEIARKLCTEKPEIKVMMLSMYMSEEFIVNAIEAGAKGYLPKTTTQKEFANGRRVLSARRAKGRKRLTV